MSFLMFPPELNSSLMFSGAGGAPMLAAAASWDGLATELGSAAQSFSSITSGLAGQGWQGPAAAAMLESATRYAGYLSAAQAQAQTAATQAQAVVSAFESARAAIVHPLAVATNRNQLVQLVVSNLFGQNAPSIAAMESEYEQMWAADVAAMIGYHGNVSAAAAQIAAWPATLQGLSAQLSGALGTNPVAAAVTSVAAGNPVAGLVTNPAQTLSADLGQAEQTIVNLINAPTNTLLGRPLIGNGASGANGTGQAGQAGGILWGNGGTGGSGGPNHPGGAGGAAGLFGNGGIGGTGGTGSYGGPGGQGGLLFGSPGTSGANGSGATTGQVGLTMYGTTEPIVYASVNGGPNVPLLVDTGSTGLVIPLQDIGIWNLGLPTGIGLSGYSGGLDYVYLTFNAPVNFSGGIVTSPTAVDVPIFSWPTSLANFPTSFSQFFASDGVVGVMGIGPNAGGPGPSSPLTALPGSLSQGVLINETTSAGTNTNMIFGPPPTGSGIATVNGAPITALDVTVTPPTGSPYSVNSLPSIIDTGGVQGTIPLDVSSGSVVDVYAPGNTTPLYSYTYNTDYYPMYYPGGLMNTGALPFLDHEVYLSNAGNGSMTFY
ncbi:PecA family PE domain-processing aspartic protease [Mycobacterium sp. HUMS_1102779]|uniref:PecA family PE domain-processing aspartic protease n=1 Tax=Mycobacterium sp. HUMS_1102779 TaxID=3383487 RepID=UPI00389A04B6